MDDSSLQDTHVATRFANLLANLGDTISASERAEVDRFLDAGESGLALETLSWILLEEDKPIGSKTLREIDSLANVMAMRKEPFVHALHEAHERQIAK